MPAQHTHCWAFGCIYSISFFTTVSWAGFFSHTLRVAYSMTQNIPHKAAIMKNPSSRLPVNRPIKKQNAMDSRDIKKMAAIIMIIKAKMEDTISADLSTDFNLSKSALILM